MPETYTQEQIYEAKEEVHHAIEIIGTEFIHVRNVKILLSALSTAERERAAALAQVAELEARLQGAGWISVGERLPESGKFVLANVDELSTPIRAFYAAPNSVEGSCEDEISIFDEEADCYWLPVGWYETNEYEEVSWFVHGKVTHWMPLPEPPAIAGNEEGV